MEPLLLPRARQNHSCCLLLTICPLYRLVVLEHVALAERVEEAERGQDEDRGGAEDDEDDPERRVGCRRLANREGLAAVEGP